MRPIRKFIIHCSDTETGNAASIDRYHREVRGWQMIGYHYVIDRDGKLEEGRPRWMAGAHCQGENSDSIGICLIGTTQFEPVQFETLRVLLTELDETYDHVGEIRGHRDYPSAKKQGKTCPSDQVENWLKEKGWFR